MSVVLKLTNVRKYFPTTKSFSQRKKEYVKAVEDVSFIIREGETVGLVGESGCGKTTVGRIILRLIAPTAGQVFFRDQDLFALRKEELRKTRKKMGVVFQDPYSSLNPRMSIQEIVAEPLKIHTNLKGLELQERMVELLKQVGLKEDCLRRYPHEFSGGQRQRIAIARALALNPAFLVLDEPTSALDVSVQAQVLNLIIELQKELNLTYLFISHDLIVVEYIADRIMVMYLGRLVEIGSTDKIFNHPIHPYTKALTSVIPIPDICQQRKEIFLEGDVPSPVNVPSGCSFHTRCPEAKEEVCKREIPILKDLGQEHWVACHLAKVES